MPLISSRPRASLETHDDATLIASVAAGDKAAMHAVYQRHFDKLFSFVRMQSGSDAVAQDVVQDTMLDVWRQAGRFQGRSSVKTWMYRIARNKLIDRQRRGARVSYMDVVPDEVDDSPNPEAVMAATQDADRVRACVEKLSKPQITVVRLAFFDDLTYEEIAQIEGIPLGTVKTRVHHAKKALMHCLGRRD